MHFRLHRLSAHEYLPTLTKMPLGGICTCMHVLEKGRSRRWTCIIQAICMLHQIETILRGFVDHWQLCWTRLRFFAFRKRSWLARNMALPQQLMIQTLAKEPPSTT